MNKVYIKKEGINNLININYPNNDDTVSLIESKNFNIIGILPLLDDECKKGELY